MFVQSAKMFRYAISDLTFKYRRLISQITYSLCIYVTELVRRYFKVKCNHCSTNNILKFSGFLRLQSLEIP